MKHAPVRHRIEFVLYRAVKRALVRGGSARARKFGEVLGNLGYRIDRRHRTTALENITRAFPDLRAGEAESIARASFVEMLTSFAEGVAAAGFDEKLLLERSEIVGAEHLPERHKGGKGFLLIGAHIGRWEPGLLRMGLLFGGLDYVARPPDNPFIARDIETIRNRFGNRAIERKGAGHRIVNALRHGHAVVLLIDQKVRPRQGIAVPFFGRPAWTTPLVAFLSIHVGVPVVPIFSLPAEGDRFRIEIEAPIAPEGKGPGEVERLTRLYNEAVERKIREHPHHYLWMHRRWG